MRRILIFGILSVLLITLLGGASWYLRLTAPMEVSQALPLAPTLVPQLKPAQPSATPGVAGLSPRIFVIDPGQSQVAYHVYETLLGEGNRINEVIGRTSAIAGEIMIDPSHPPASQIGEIVVDINQLKSDNRDRDNALRREWLESAKYPLVRFSNSSIGHLPAELREGQPFSFTLSGLLTLHDTTQPVTWHVEATLQGDLLRGSARTELHLPSFNVKPPNVAGIVATEETARLEIALVAKAKSEF